MKKFNLLFILYLIAFFSCTKSDVISEENNYSIPHTIIEKVKCENGILIFDDFDSYNFVLDKLEFENQKWIENNCDKPLTDLNFNENYVFEAFESNFDYSSKRNQIFNNTEDWLNNTELDLENDPDEYIISDKCVRTLLNDKDELIIGTSIFKLDPESGDVYEVIKKDFASLAQLRINNFKNHSESDNIFFHANSNLKSVSDDDDCKANKYSTKYVNYETDKLIKCKISVNNIWPFIHNVLGETTSYKLSGMSWVRDKQNLKVLIAGQYRDTDCDIVWSDKGYPNPNYINLYQRDEDASYVYVKASLNGPFRVKSNDVYSVHEVGYTVECSITLTW